MIDEPYADHSTTSSRPVTARDEGTRIARADTHIPTVKAAGARTRTARRRASNSATPPPHRPGTEALSADARQTIGQSLRWSPGQRSVVAAAVAISIAALAAARSRRS